MLTDSFLEVSISKRYIKRLANCEDIVSIKASRAMRVDRSPEVLVRSSKANRDRHEFEYVKKVHVVLPTQIKICGKENISFHQKRKSTLSRIISLSTSIDNIRTCSAEVKRR